MLAEVLIIMALLRQHVIMCYSYIHLNLLHVYRHQKTASALTWNVNNGNQLTAKTETMTTSMRTTRFRSSSRLTSVASNRLDVRSPGVVRYQRVWAIRPYATNIVSTCKVHHACSQVCHGRPTHLYTPTHLPCSRVLHNYDFLKEHSVTTHISF